MFRQFSSVQSTQKAPFTIRALSFTYLLSRRHEQRTGVRSDRPSSFSVSPFGWGWEFFRASYFLSLSFLFYLPTFLASVFVLLFFARTWSKTTKLAWNVSECSRRTVHRWRMGLETTCRSRRMTAPSTVNREEHNVQGVRFFPRLTQTHHTYLHIYCASCTEGAQDMIAEAGPAHSLECHRCAPRTHIGVTGPFFWL